MRRYDVVSRILLILSIIGFAFAAPVLVQENCQACANVVHIPKDVITVLGKRMDEEELEKLLDKYIKMENEPVESSDTHASSSSAPPGPDHGSTNVVQAPASNPASSLANPDPSMELPGTSSTAPMTVPEPEFDWEYWGNLVDPRPLKKPPNVMTDVVQAPALNPASSIANPDQLVVPSGSSSSTASSEGSWETHFIIMQRGMTYFRIKAMKTFMTP